MSRTTSVSPAVGSFGHMEGLTLKRATDQQVCIFDVGHPDRRPIVVEIAKPGINGGQVRLVVAADINTYRIERPELLKRLHPGIYEAIRSGSPIQAGDWNDYLAFQARASRR